jgi:hypothetical protein
VRDFQRGDDRVRLVKQQNLGRKDAVSIECVVCSRAEAASSDVGPKLCRAEERVLGNGEELERRAEAI